MRVLLPRDIGGVWPASLSALSAVCVVEPVSCCRTSLTYYSDRSSRRIVRFTGVHLQAFNASNGQAARVGGGGGHGTPLPSRPATSAGGRASRSSSDAQAPASAAATASQQVLPWSPFFLT